MRLALFLMISFIQLHELTKPYMGARLRFPGNFNIPEARRLVNVLRAGALQGL